MTLVIRIVDHIVSMLAAVGSATSAAGAVEASRAPAPSDLRRLGIDPRVFLTIGHG